MGHATATYRLLVACYEELGRRLHATASGLRSDHGQTAAEYVGIIVIVGLILLAIDGNGLGDSIMTGLSTTIDSILNR